jgi:hypothetical protein
MRLSAPIATARRILNDAGVVAYTEPDLLGYANDALDAILALAPRWFHTRATLACVAGDSEQTLSFADAHALVLVERVVGGNAVLPCDRGALDRYNPAWESDAAGTAVNWMASASNPVAFSVYPKAPVAQSLEVVYVRVPGEYADSADTGLPDTLAPAVADYIVAMAMLQDDEHVNAGRAAQAMNNFTSRIGAAA